MAVVDSARVLEQAEAILRRVSPERRRLAQRSLQRRWRGFVRRLTRAMLAMLGVLVAAALFGFFIAPLGIGGALLTMVTMALVAAIILFWPAADRPTPETLMKSDLTMLPGRVEEWLAAQRASLPPPAARIADSIGVQLEALAPQLQTLDPREPAAAAIRKLLSTELPELVDGYARVPRGMRPDGRNGMSPDKQLVDGLNLVSSEIARMTEQLASGDLDKLATQGRYLELKYRGVE